MRHEENIAFAACAEAKEDITVITATKIFTAFDIFKALCIGADVCSTARGMMLVLGCIQALECDTNKCPTGVTSHKPNLMRGLVVKKKWQYVKNYHERTLHEFAELFAAAGCEKLSDMDRSFIFKQVETEVECYEQLYPPVSVGEFHKEAYNEF